MSWTEICQFTLYPCDMCIGQLDFKPFIPADMKYGLEPGKYQIQYISGAVRSNSYRRYEKFLINQETYTNRWNKYFVISQLTDQALQSINYTILPQFKFNVLQCQYGTLPGFTKIGALTKQLAEEYVISKTIEGMYDQLSSQLAPLTFQTQQLNSISFWYTDDCAPCVQGNITYKLYKFIDNTNVAINGISIISYNIYNLQANIPQYYKLIDKEKNELTNIPYIYQQNLLSVCALNDYMLNLKKYNKIGYDNNQNNINLTYKNSYQNYLSDNIIWKIKKIKKQIQYNIITEITQTNKQIPLFAGVYTIIPSLELYFQSNIKILEIKLDKNSDVSEVLYNKNGNIQEYTFILKETSMVRFFIKGCYLYSGIISANQLLNTQFSTQQLQLINKQQQLENKTDIENHEINIKKNEINFISTDYYIYVSNTFMEIVLYKSQSLNYWGPFNSIQQAQETIIKYCIKNSIDYQKLTDTKYVIG